MRFLTPELIVTILAIVALLITSAFFSASETALTAASRAKLKGRANKGSTGAKTAMRVTEDGERMIGALLLGNNVANILSASIATAALTRLVGDNGVAVATAVMTVLVLVFAEVLPKTLAIIFPETVAVRVAPVVRVLIILFSPIVTVVRLFVRGLLKLFGLNADPNSLAMAHREEIMGAIALGHSEGAFEKADRDRLLGALDLADRTVDEIMRHRRDIQMINADHSPDEIIAEVLASSHTRLPVFRDNEENILGILHSKDLWREVNRLRRGGDGLIDDLDIIKVAMKPYFIPDTTTLDDQMREFLKRSTHFALVVDEYGSLQGLITLEDILEEIVGEINDEFDIAPREKPLARTETGAYIVDGAMTIRDLNRAMEWHLPDDEANTVAGLVIHEAQTIPTVGQAFSFHGFRFEVAARRENRLTQLLVRPL